MKGLRIRTSSCAKSRSFLAATAPHEDAEAEPLKSHLCRGDNGSLEFHDGPASQLASPRNRNVESWTRSEQPLLETEASRRVQTMPLFNGNQNRGFDSAARYNLRASFDGGVEELAKTRPCILNSPFIQSLPLCPNIILRRVNRARRKYRPMQRDLQQWRFVR